MTRVEKRRVREIRRRAVVARAFEAILKDTHNRNVWVLFCGIGNWCGGNGRSKLGFYRLDMKGWVGSFLV